MAIFVICACGSRGNRVSKIALFLHHVERALTGGQELQPQKQRLRPPLAIDGKNFKIHNMMMMMRDTVRPQVDMLSEGMRNYRLDHQELRIHYPMKITWRSVKVSDMRQNGFKLTRK